jgi:hypothetical protein
MAATWPTRQAPLRSTAALHLPCSGRLGDLPGRLIFPDETTVSI